MARAAPVTIRFGSIAHYRANAVRRTTGISKRQASTKRSLAQPVGVGRSCFPARNWKTVLTGQSLDPSSLRQAGRSNWAQRFIAQKSSTPMPCFRSPSAPRPFGGVGLVTGPPPGTKAVGKETGGGYGCRIGAAQPQPHPILREVKDARRVPYLGAGCRCALGLSRPERGSQFSTVRSTQRTLSSRPPASSSSP